jgi:hypothetical protein
MGKCFQGNPLTVFLVAAFSSLYLLVLLLTFYPLIFYYNKLELVKSTLKIYFKILKHDDLLDG